MTEARAISDGRLTDAELSEAIKRSAGRTDKMTIDAEKAHGLFSELLALRGAVKQFAALAKLDRGHRPTDNLMSIYATDGVAKVSYGDLYRLGALLEPADV